MPSSDHSEHEASTAPKRRVASNVDEELEDLGEKGDRDNTAKRYMNLVRKRKGLRTDQRLVVSAEKQRTLKST